MALSIEELLHPDAIRVPLVAGERRGAIEELVDVLSATGVISDPESFKKSVWERELQRSTGIGEGLAIPHGKSAGVVRPAIAVGKPAMPLEFGAIDRRPVRLVVLLASPPDRTSDHIQVLHRISRIFSDVATRERVCLASDAKCLCEELLRADRLIAQGA